MRVIGHDSIEFATLTDVGVRRSYNQDAYAALPATDAEQWRARGHLFLVADGMGAHAVGELASKLAADHIPHLFSKHAHEGPVAALRKAFVEANFTIHTRGQQNREFEGMGTTATAILLRPEGAWIGHVGDSRCYRIRNEQIEQLSFDHSLLWELARRQHKEPEELQGIPHNVIVRSLGPEPLVQVDVEGPHPLAPGDLFLLCSDGLSGPVSDREIGAVVSVLPPAEACRFLIHLANLQGGPDNITAVIVRVPPTPPAPENISPSANGASASPPAPADGSLGKKLRGFPWPLLALFLGILLAITAIALTFNHLPGAISAFLLAAVALMFGLGGLWWQFAQEKNLPTEEVEPRLNVYRQTPCTIDGPFIKRLATAVQDLEKRLRDSSGAANWNSCRQHLDQGTRLLQEGSLREACAEHCRALLVLMEAAHKQGGQEEWFKPFWESTAKGA